PRRQKPSQSRSRGTSAATGCSKERARARPRNFGSCAGGSPTRVSSGRDRRPRLSGRVQLTSILTGGGPGPSPVLIGHLKEVRKPYELGRTRQSAVSSTGQIPPAGARHEVRVRRTHAYPLGQIHRKGAGSGAARQRHRL